MKQKLIFIASMFIGLLLPLKIFGQQAFIKHTLIFRDKLSLKKIEVELWEGEIREYKLRKSMYYVAKTPKALKKYALFSDGSSEYIFSGGFRVDSSFSGGARKCQRDTTKKAYTLFGLHNTLPHSPPNCDEVCPVFVLGKPTSWRHTYLETKDNIYRTDKYYLADNTSYPTYTYKFYSGQNYEYNFRIYDFCPRIGIVKFTFKDRVNTPKERQRTYILYSIDGLSVEEFCRQGKCITICCDLKEVE
jgi:hypothetical protein